MSSSGKRGSPCSHEYCNWRSFGVQEQHLRFKRLEKLSSTAEEYVRRKFHVHGLVESNYSRFSSAQFLYSEMFRFSVKMLAIRKT